LMPAWDSKIVIPEGLAEINKLETSPRAQVVYRILKVVN